MYKRSFELLQLDLSVLPIFSAIRKNEDGSCSFSISYEQSLLEQYGLLDRPAGVGFSWFQINPYATFGFAGQELQPFDRGVFTPFTEQTPA